uniref:Sushi domain containing 2 n=1 Tax=Gadus morhua TaxID=8049 RepID=A0A8C5FVH1_GADMO
TTCVSLQNCCADYDQFCLQPFPYSASMLGGSIFTLSNITFPPTERILCRYKGGIVIEGFVNAEGHAHCITPLLFEKGWVPFDVSTDGVNFDRSGEYLSGKGLIIVISLTAILANATRWQYYGTPNTVLGELQMTWNSSLIISAERVNIELWGYREVNSTPGTGRGNTNPLKAEWTYLYSLGKNLSNSGVFSFLPKPTQKPLSDWELGSIHVRSASHADGARNVQGLWSEEHTLAWHLEQAFRDDSTGWALAKCLQWDTYENSLPNFMEELKDCPCTLALARADTGRFEADYSCDMDKGSVCIYHPGSFHCVRSIQASPTYGSGQQCCYDKTGAQILTGDSTSGSSPDRVHEMGSHPYRVATRVPGLSHWLADVQSYFYCCLWSDHCDVYFARRSSMDCRRYEPPRSGVVIGDGNFVTFDNLEYTFNGRGEYDLVTSPDKELSVQVRTEQVKLKSGALREATRLSSVAMREGSSDVVEVRLAGGQMGSLQVLRNQRAMPFTEQSRMDLHGVFMSSPCPENVTVMFASGVGLEVRAYQGLMTVTVLLPTAYTNHTHGLLGQMNSDLSDDLQTRLGQVLPSANATPEGIFSFGASWDILNETFLFTYDSKYLLDTHTRTPDSGSGLTPALYVPEDAGGPLAEDTLRVLQIHQALQQTLQPVVACGWLPSPKNGTKHGKLYIQGGNLSFSCDDGYTLTGSLQRSCLPNGSWSGEQAYCT